MTPILISELDLIQVVCKNVFFVILLFSNKDFVALVSSRSCFFSAKNRFSFKVNVRLFPCMCFVIDRCRTHQL